MSRGIVPALSIQSLSIQSLSIPAFEGEADPGKSLYLKAYPVSYEYAKCKSAVILWTRR
jgi:hypothetical protein